MVTPEKLLVLYTDGTIGMQMSESGLAPASGFEARLRAEQAAHPERPAPAWRFAELSPPIDSANMRQQHWLAMRDARSPLAVRIADGAAGPDLRGLVYESTAMQRVVSLALQVAAADVPVLITGPNGVGKEKLAEIIQANSSRRSRPWESPARPGSSRTRTPCVSRSPSRSSGWRSRAVETSTSSRRADP